MVILAILMFLAPCSDDLVLTGQSCYIVKDVLANDSIKGHINKVQVGGQVYTVKKEVKVIMTDTGILTIDKFGKFSFAPYSCFKGRFILRYWIGKDWAYIDVKVVQMVRKPEDKPYCYVLTKGNTQIYYLLARQTYLGQEYYYYDTGGLLFPLTYIEWRYWFKQKITMP